MNVGTILTASRRSVTILDEKFNSLSGQLSSKTLNVTVGDRVQFSIKNGAAFVQEIEPHRNTIARSYFNEVRKVASNVDHLFIGSAVSPLFNTSFIDRLLAVARFEEIPATLLVNKVDLGLEETDRLIELYRGLGVDLLLTSAVRGDGMVELQEILAKPDLRLVVMAGISGVGKSTIVNSLIPGANIRVGDVSERTGQGKQTTAQPVGHLYPRSGLDPLIIVDLPGIQRFGTAHLPKEIISSGFSEIADLQSHCKYSDCSHTMEDDCAVKAALEENKISPSRYVSYCDMYMESEEAKNY